MSLLESEPTGNATPDLTGAIAQLRGLMCGLWVGLLVVSLGLLVVSLAFSAFVEKQNRHSLRVAATQHEQVIQLRAMQQRLAPALNELAQYSLNKPDYLTIFRNYGISVQPSPAPAVPKR